MSLTLSLSSNLRMFFHETSLHSMHICLRIPLNRPPILMPNEVVSCWGSSYSIPTKRPIPCCFLLALDFHSFHSLFCLKMNMALNMLIHFGMLLLTWTNWVGGWFAPFF